MYVMIFDLYQNQHAYSAVLITQFIQLCGSVGRAKLDRLSAIWPFNRNDVP